jgi:hypothetical protein
LINELKEAFSPLAKSVEEANVLAIIPSSLVS